MSQIFDVQVDLSFLDFLLGFQPREFLDTETLTNRITAMRAAAMSPNQKIRKYREPRILLSTY
jgi:hypothetical protein